MKPFETFTHNGYTVNLYPDTDPQSPENDDGILIVTTQNRHFRLLHDGQDAAGCMADKSLRKRYWIFPLRAYIHSGIALSLSDGGQFSDPWDSGQIGFVFVAKSEFKYRTRERKRCVSALTAAKSYVESWNQYLSGDVWGFSIETPDGEDVDSCWGFYGLDYARSEAKDSVPETAAVVGGDSEDRAHDDSLV